MKKVIILLAALAVAAPALAVPGIDLSGNNICPGAAGASGNGGIPDCSARAATGQFVSLFGTFICAEPIADLSGIEGQVSVSLIGDMTNDGPTGASFWTSQDGGCVVNNGGQVKFLGSKPTWPPASTQCGTSLGIREWFTTGGSGLPSPIDNSHLNYFFNVFR